MQILIADDDPVPRGALDRTLKKWGHDVVLASDGGEACQLLQREDAPKLAILDWVMPKLDGPQICRKIRDLVRQQPTYIILLTSKHQKEDVVAGLESGADDFITKPFDQHELRSRIRVGERIVMLQQKLADRVHRLEEALAQVTQRRGLLPMCSYCRKIRDDQNYWHDVERYLAAHTDVHFSHGICPNCWNDVVQPELAKAREAQG
ncbi:MAG: response regulator transcription factor [Planctomycetes bacterium]|nr:response regulator transcription factor [Planctomycetota bacterium]